MSEPFVHISNLEVRYRQQAVLKDLEWKINYGDNWLICGDSGSGKTSLGKAIAGMVPFSGKIGIGFNPLSPLPPLVYYVANWYQFKDLEGQSNFYYQQRYNTWAVEVTATIQAELEFFCAEHHLNFSDVADILEKLGYSELMGSTLIQLSSGEHKKLQLIKAIWLAPQLLVLDQPYNGLDKNSRQNLNVLLDQLTAGGTQLILIGNDTDLPACVNRYAEIVGGRLREVSEADRTQDYTAVIADQLPGFLNAHPVHETPGDIISMRNVNISYGEKQVLKDINWQVKAGEKWLLQGHNGSGKSTLLSLICGDHPQAYANDYSLFGQKRGTGESIWEIKARIGLISPELHWYFDRTATVWQSVASGFYDSSGLFCDPGSSKHEMTDELLDYLGLTPYRDTLMNELPLGKQRLALLGRTIIKNPELLILDEPCQGLDIQQTRHFNELVDRLCGNNGTTLIYVGHFETQLPDCIEKKIILENGKVKAVEEIKKTEHYVTRSE